MCQNKEKIRLRSRVRFAKLFAGQESTSPHICSMNSNLLIDKWLLLIAFHFFSDVHAKPPPALSDNRICVKQTSVSLMSHTSGLWYTSCDQLAKCVFSSSQERPQPPRRCINHYIAARGENVDQISLLIELAGQNRCTQIMGSRISLGIVYGTTVVNHDTDEITRRGWYAFDKNASTLHTQPCD